MQDATAGKPEKGFMITNRNTQASDETIAPSSLLRLLFA